MQGNYSKFTVTFYPKDQVYPDFGSVTILHETSEGDGVTQLPGYVDINFAKAIARAIDATLVIESPLPPVVID